MEMGVWLEENLHQVARTLSVARSHCVRQHLEQTLGFLGILLFLRTLLLFPLGGVFYEPRDPLVFLFFLFRRDWLTIHKFQAIKIPFAGLNSHLHLFFSRNTRFYFVHPVTVVIGLSLQLRIHYSPQKFTCRQSSVAGRILNVSWNAEHQEGGSDQARNAQPFRRFDDRFSKTHSTSAHCAILIEGVVGGNPMHSVGL